MPKGVVEWPSQYSLFCSPDMPEPELFLVYLTGIKEVHVSRGEEQL